jgi:hypothetical protein
MSWVWKADAPLRSEEQVAREVHEVALARQLDDLATVLALMCIRQESNFWCPFNRADPSSEQYDHDSESDDGRSVGYFQQQNGAPGESPPPAANWWGDMASRMDLKRSADTFLQRLSDDYVTVRDAGAASAFIQRVQRSAYPDAYAKHWDYCWDLLRTEQKKAPVAPVPPAAPVPLPISLLRPDFQERQMFGWGGTQRSRPPINFFIHTQEGSWDATAKDLAAFCQGQNDVSYHYTLRDRILYDVVDEALYAWAVLNANVFSVNLCFAGSSVSQTREQWLARYGPDIEIAAYIAVRSSRRNGNYSTGVIVPPYNGAARPGISDHKYVTQKLGIGTHTDVGDNFPWDVFTEHVNRFAAGPAAPGEDDDVDAEAKQWIKDIRDAVVEDGGIPSDSPYAPQPPPRFSLKDLVKFTDAAAHALAVETGASMGNLVNLQQVWSAAQAGSQRAKDMWAKLPQTTKDLLKPL